MPTWIVSVKDKVDNAENAKRIAKISSCEMIIKMHTDGYQQTPECMHTPASLSD